MLRARALRDQEVSMAYKKRWNGAAERYCGSNIVFASS